MTHELAICTKSPTSHVHSKNDYHRTYLMVRLVVSPPVNAGDRAQSLVREASTCCGATKPIRHNFWACILEPESCNYWSPSAFESVLNSKRSRMLQLGTSPHLLQWEKVEAQRWRLSTVKKLKHNHHKFCFLFEAHEWIEHHLCGEKKME